MKKPDHITAKVYLQDWRHWKFKLLQLLLSSWSSKPLFFCFEEMFVSPLEPDEDEHGARFRSVRVLSLPVKNS